MYVQFHAGCRFLMPWYTQCYISACRPDVYTMQLDASQTFPCLCHLITQEALL